MMNPEPEPEVLLRTLARRLAEEEVKMAAYLNSRLADDALRTELLLCMAKLAGQIAAESPHPRGFQMGVDMVKALVQQAADENRIPEGNA